MFEIMLKFCAIIYCFQLIEANSTLNVSSATESGGNITFSGNSTEYNSKFLIAGGYPVPEKFPYLKYMVSIRSRNPQRFFGDNHFCAGTIISKTAVLTAAHCVMDKRRVLTRARSLLLVAGTPNRLLPVKTTVQLPAKSVKAHTDFIRKNYNDIAIIHLKKEIPIDNENIKIMKMASGPPPYGVQCTITGWGRLMRKGPLAAKAMTVDVLLFNEEQCKYYMQRHYHDGVLCAGDSTGQDEDPCRGDSGGPLICNNELTGIISWTIGCGTDDFPSLYTGVWYHRDWIAKNLNKADMLQVNFKILALLAAVIISMV